jgi:hypothetical protein
VKINLYLCNESFDINLREDGNITNLLEELAKIFKQIRINNETIFNSLLWYSQIFDNNQTIDEWMYDTYSGEFLEEKLLLQDLIKQTNSIDDADYLKELVNIKNNSTNFPGAIICFNHINKFSPPEYFNIHSIIDLIVTHRFYLYKAKNNEELFTGFFPSFPNLHFGISVLSSMHVFKPLHDYKGEIISHLTVLNDFAYELYNELGQGKEAEMIKKLKTKVECSGQGDPEYVDGNLKFDFLNDLEISESVKCGPHTKLFHKGSDYRIYFSWPKEGFNNQKSILIGHIGGHQ